MNVCRAALRTWWKLMQTLADPRLDSEVRAGNMAKDDVSSPSAQCVPSTTALALSQLGLLDDSRETTVWETDHT